MGVQSSPFYLNCHLTVQGMHCQVRKCPALFSWRYEHVNDIPLCAKIYFSIKHNKSGGCLSTPTQMRGGLAAFFWELQVDPFKSLQLLYLVSVVARWTGSDRVVKGAIQHCVWHT